jgi:cellulose synthase/poly-beta-1,6-N-acetylglucosamine synthase-like glycosyltransferase
MFLIVEMILFALLVYTVASVCYQFILALTYFITREPKQKTSGRHNRFAIIVPAHNEELLISKTCENLTNIDYPSDRQEVFVIADNCTDKTVDICKALPVKVMCRYDEKYAGKGYALKWAFEQVELEKFDAVLILDADTTVEPNILKELNAMLNDGSQAIQCYIRIPNRAESWFTQLIFVSRVINNLLYHYAKFKLGLSSYLMGSGMCFRTALLREQKWSAFTLSEDWEYFAKLIEQGKKVDFAVRAEVLQQESRSLRQATTQRLRWSKGRFYVVKHLGMNLLLKGLRSRNWIMADASLALLFPNWSLQINLILLTLVMSLMLPVSTFKSAALILCLGMLGTQGIILVLGVFLAGQYRRVLMAILAAPLFLVWKLAIDFVSMTGIYRGKEWIRTERHVPDETSK